MKKLLILIVLLFSAKVFALSPEQRGRYRYQLEEQKHSHRVEIIEVKHQGQVLAMRVYLTRRAYNPYGYTVYRRPYYRTPYRYNIYRNRTRNRISDYCRSNYGIVVNGNLLNEIIP